MSAPIPKPTCAASGTHAGQSWKCTRASQDKARHLGHVCAAHYRQWERAGYPDAFSFSPLRTYEAGAERAELRLYASVDLVEGLRARAAAEGCSVAALCRPALKRLLGDDS